MPSERSGQRPSAGLGRWLLAAGLALMWAQARAVDFNSENMAPFGPLAQRKPVFSEVRIVTNTPPLFTNAAGTLTNATALGALVEPRLVTNPSSPAASPTALPLLTKDAEPATVGRSMESLDSRQKLGVGDRVTFRVLEDQEEPKPLTITDAGELDVPELGLVTAVGKTCKELAYEVKAKLEETTYYHATVILGVEYLNKTPSGRRVYVSGYVQRPGQQEIPGGETWTVAKAIMRAGGFTVYADKKHVQLVRAGHKGTAGQTYVVNVAEVLEKGRTDKDMAVEPEDFIIVPPRGVVF